MSFFGKQFKKAKVENAAEFLGKLSLSEQTLAMLRSPNSVTTFTKNSDGSIQYLVKDADGKTILDQKLVLDNEVDFRAPDGMATKVKFTLKGDLFRSHMQFPDGKVVNMDRTFEANGFKLELYIDGTSEKATIYYELV